MRVFRRGLRALALAVALGGISAAPAFDAKPWLEDLGQVRAALIDHYANLDWAVRDREANLPRLYDETVARIKAAKNESDARTAFERFERRIGDGHIDFRWKEEAGDGPPQDRCAALGYDPAQQAAPLAALAPGYRALGGAAEFPSGLIDVDGRRVGVVKIGEFAPDGTPALCAAALKALSIPADKPCDDACAARVSRWAHNRMTEDFAEQLRALESAGAQILMIDIAGNGGGSEWAEAAARMVTAAPLKAERMAFVRSPGWSSYWRDQEAALRGFAHKATPPDRALLLSLANQVHAKGLDAARRCDGGAIWQGARPACSWLAQGFFASGLLASADPGRLRGKPFAETLFSPMEYPYAVGVWRGPLIVLVDRNSFSASEEFAAELQDNRAAIVLGEPTGGAGCGHALEGQHDILKNSGAILEMPDCARLRADGSNEVIGVEPDVFIGFTPRDGPRIKGRRIRAALPQAVARALKLR